MAIKFIRENSTYLLQPSQEGVVYFADDDNSYDLRLFNDYIRNVKTVGMWAVGTVLSVEHGKKTCYRTSWRNSG